MGDQIFVDVHETAPIRQLALQAVAILLLLLLIE